MLCDAMCCVLTAAAHEWTPFQSTLGLPAMYVSSISNRPAKHRIWLMFFCCWGHSGGMPVWVHACKQASWQAPHLVLAGLVSGAARESCTQPHQLYDMNASTAHACHRSLLRQTADVQLQKQGHGACCARSAVVTPSFSYSLFLLLLLLPLLPLLPLWLLLLLLLLLCCCSCCCRCSCGCCCCCCCCAAVAGVYLNPPHCVIAKGQLCRVQSRRRCLQG